MSDLNGVDLRDSFRAIPVREVPHPTPWFIEEMVILWSAFDGTGLGTVGAVRDKIIYECLQ